MMQLLRLAVATVTILGVSVIPCVNSIKVGDKLPSAEVHSGFPPNKIDFKKYTADKSVLLIGLPGAFTPT